MTEVSIVPEVWARLAHASDDSFLFAATALAIVFGSVLLGKVRSCASRCKHSNTKAATTRCCTMLQQRTHAAAKHTSERQDGIYDNVCFQCSNVAQCACCLHRWIMPSEVARKMRLRFCAQPPACYPLQERALYHVEYLPNGG